jgi:hypothetical protein
LPDNRITEGFAGGAAPSDGGFALVCDANRRDIMRADITDNGIQDCLLDIQNFISIMFDPATLRKVLRKGLLVGCDGSEGFIEGDGAAACRPGIHGDEDGG